MPISVTVSPISIISGLAAATGDDHVLHRRTRLQIAEHLIEIEVAVLEGDVQFIEHHQTDRRITQQLARHCPCGFGGGDVALTVLGFPGEALAHHVETHLLGEAAEEQLFAGAVAALDELHHAALHAVAHGAGEHAERRAAFAFAVTGEHQHQAALVGRVGDAFVDHGFFALHTRQMAFVALGGISHGGALR